MQSFWQLLGYLRNYKLFVVLNVLSNILTAVFTIVSLPLMIPFFNILFEQENEGTSVGDFQTYLQDEFTNYITLEGKEAGLVVVCGIIILSFFFKNLFRYFSMFFMAPVRNGIIRDIRKQVFDKILILPISYFSEEKKGDLLSRITADVQEIEWSILNVLEAVFREPLIIIGSLGFMLYVSPNLTLFVFILIIFTAVVIGGIGRTLRKPSAEVQETLGTLVSIVEEALGALRVIKGFNAEGYQSKKFGESNDQYRWALTRLLWRKDLASPLSEFLGISVVSILLWYGSRQVFSGELDASTFIAFIMAFYYVIDPSKSLTRAVYNIQKGIASMHRVEKVLSAPQTIKETEKPAQLTDFQREITYGNVSFKYKSSEFQVLSNIDLTIPKGKIIAIVGASGSGKSTLVDLLPRFYDVGQGEIRIDGVDIRDMSLKDLRNLMGIVTQEPLLFNDTIYNNIAFGLEHVTPEEVKQAASIAHAHDFIMETELGYQTNIGDRGTKLSGGQRQRITLARAVLKDPPILILDEATSALDSESEQIVQQALVEVMKNRTALVIAHRLSTIQHADKIVVMKAGKIVESGTHQSLITQKGEYHKLVALQAM